MRICLPKFIIRCARNPDSKEFLDLEFDIRPGSYSSKWIDCIRSVEHLPPYQYGFPKWVERDPGIFMKRVREQINSNANIQKFLIEQDVSYQGQLTPKIVNTVHRYLEVHDFHIDELLTLHNDIHYLESVWEDSRQMLDRKLSIVPDDLKLELKNVVKKTVENYIIEYQKHDYVLQKQLQSDLSCLVENFSEYGSELPELPNAGILKKLQWVPPGLTIDMTLDDYREFTTEPCTNFIQDDFSHVGRSPHNSYLYQDDTSLYTSCVIQHKVGSGAKWFIPDDSHIFGDVQGFRAWVSEHQDFFRNQWGIETNDDPRLCHGRIIIATGCDDYSRIDRQFDFIVKAFIQ
jgi:hypothetical protein